MSELNVEFPLPRPSPLPKGRGRIAHRLSAYLRRRTPFALAALASLVATAGSAQSQLRLDAGMATNAWIVSHQGQPLLRYVFNPRQYKPYVAEFSAPGGRNVLRDAPFDHLHHHGLMYAIKVNG